MNATFTKTAFDVVGQVVVTMADGRVFNSAFPAAVWRWIDGKNWKSVTIWDDRFQQSYGWDRF